MYKIFAANKNLLTFIYCVFCALFFWTTVKFSKINRKEIPVQVQVVNIPEALSFESENKNYVQVTVRGSAYSLLKYYLNNPLVTVDYNDLQPIGEGMYRIGQNAVTKRQQDAGLDIEKSNSDTLYLTMHQNYTKKIPVRVDLNAQFARGYRLNGLQVMPDTVQVRGFGNEIDTMHAVYVKLPLKQEVNNSFEQTVKLISTSQLQYDTNQILVKATVDKFSERIIKAVVRAVNVPSGQQIKLYPETVEILCAGSFDLIKNITSDDIVVEADYAERGGNSGMLSLDIRTEIKGVKITFYKDEEIDYLIREIK
ncbi:MAG: hypothetical protein Q4G08_05500 [Capnocytophaga sp.]|nr:hypothetical protein [Capnocytophaga sp.]